MTFEIKEENRLAVAIEKMARMGHNIEKENLPGLYRVDGRELTEMQVIHYASQIGD